VKGLSSSESWSGRPDSNRGPLAHTSSPHTLSPHIGTRALKPPQLEASLRRVPSKRGVGCLRIAPGVTLSQVHLGPSPETERGRRPSPSTSLVGSPSGSKSQGNQPCLLQRRHKSSCRPDRERSPHSSGQLLLRPPPSADSPAVPLRLGERSAVSLPLCIPPGSQPYPNGLFRAHLRRDADGEGADRTSHPQPQRPQGPRLVRVNCSAISAGLVESELFGHLKGAFTGAIEWRGGRFELADGGSIFMLCR
jgi:hypothetical protein